MGYTWRVHSGCRLHTSLDPEMVTQMEIRIAENEAELQQCLQVRMEVFVGEQNVPADLEVDEFDVYPFNCTHVLVTDGGQPVGAARLRGYENNSAKYQRIAVLKSYRGQGVGALLLGALDKIAIEQGYSSAVLDSQCQAEAFYSKSGFHVVSTETFLDAGIPHVRMTKTFEVKA
ncbi:GNAT family N-acetyltransferase [Paenibacillus gansuensis]|uniref:GNAT family N-acetyltransferase n=1 Tax=Paenibacillus gansuensis TaxID=306542 RepID=A0ABW5PE46_9BACL